MKTTGKFSTFALALGVMVATAGSVTAEPGEYSYKVHNKTDSKIVKLLASEDGKSYGEFDIGSGIAPGATETLVWDKSTDEEGCEQWVKAKYADGETSPPAKFDFCEDDVVLDFE